MIHKKVHNYETVRNYIFSQFIKIQSVSSKTIQSSQSFSCRFKNDTQKKFINFQSVQKYSQLFSQL